MKRFLASLALALLTVLAPVTAMAGLITISLEPSPTKIHAGNNIYVDINISGLQSGGLENLLSAWSLDVHYNSELLIPLLAAPAGFGTRLGDIFAGEAIGGLDTSTAGVLELFQVSLLSNAALDSLQRDAGGNLLDSFTIATLGFYAPMDSTFNGGSATFFTTNIVLGDANGDPISDANGVVMPIQHPAVTVPVPEPGTLALAALALMGTLLPRWRRAAPMPT